MLGALRDLAQYGTTTVEAKSGYGLSLDSELKSLQAIRAAAKQWPGTVLPTFLGAHVVPPEYRGRSQKYVDLVCKEMIPAVAKARLARFVDVFCDRGAFSADEAEQIFKAATQHGLAVRAHMGQLTETRITPFLKFHPASLDHMDHVNDADLPALAASDTVATLVPGANYFLGSNRYPDARKLIERRGRGGAGYGLQPGNIADRQHADGVVFSVYAHEDVSGGSDCGGHDQWRLGPEGSGSQRQPRARQRCRPRGF